ncbi:MAG: TenA family protein [Candidatus Bathyarchaeia archaeon]|jgi:thiaminase/transcriptional activator TenA
MKLSSMMRETADKQFHDFLKRPFITELGQGKLSLAKFRYYIIQDNLFLEDATQARRLMAAKAPRRLRANLDRLLKSMNRFELFSRRQAVSKRLGITASTMRQAHRSPTTITYTSFLIRTAAIATVGESLAAMMACPWTYSELGEKYANSIAMKHPIFGPWLTIYQTPAMNSWLEELKNIIDKIPAQQRIKRRMIHNFVTACKLECMFWDMAYRMEKWPY